jgi:hypothetical protein
LFGCRIIPVVSYVAVLLLQLLRLVFACAAHRGGLADVFVLVQKP